MTDIVQKRELAKEADEILKSPAFAKAKADLLARLQTKLLSATSTEQKLDIIGEMKAVEDIAAHLKLLINDYNAEVRQLQSMPLRGQANG